MIMRHCRLPAVLIAALACACQPTNTITEQSAENRAQLAQLNTELGVQYMQKGEYQIAVDKLEKALQAQPDYVEAHNVMGLLRGTLNQDKEAEASFRRALAIEPGNPSVLNNYGQFLCQNERSKEGQEMFLKAIENPLYRNPAVAWSNAGTCALKAGDTDTAERDFRAALEIDSALAPALYQMAELSFAQGHHEQARAYLKRYVENAQHSARSLWLGVRIERALGNRNAASSYALQLEKNFPDSMQTKELLESAQQ